MTIQQTFDLAMQHLQDGRMREAEQLCRQVLAQEPKHADAIHILGLIAHQAGRNLVALDLIRRAIALRPDRAEAHGNLGNVLKDNGQLDEAIAAYGEALALRPDYAEAHSNLGVALLDKGQPDAAIAAYRQAICFKPDFALAHNNLAYVLLARGDFEEGWRELEWRLKCNFSQSPRRDFSQPQWDGGPLEARTVLLQCEQGLGDTLQFIRYFPLVAQRGGKVVIECQAELQRLFQMMAPGCQVVARGQPLPAFDLYRPLVSLPGIFQTTLANIPNAVPYLNADPTDAGKWRHRLADGSSVLNVGLVWAGSSTNPNNRHRSIKLANLASLGQAPGVRFVSLQKGIPAAEAKNPPAGMKLVDWTAQILDFADTAALIANLDLVISVDTSVTHLAGAMGKPVWTLLPFISDWRWLTGREDSPWYPTMRLFRQAAAGDWSGLISRIAKELGMFAAKRVASSTPISGSDG